MSEENTKKPEINKKPVTIERAVSGDAEAIFEIKRQGWLNTYPNEDLGISVEYIRGRVEGEYGERIPRNIERWRNKINITDGTKAIFVARINGKVAGFVAPGFTDGQRRLGALYVLPEAQGKGIGGGLMRKALEWHGSDEDVYLVVASYNQNAIDFYKSFGFEETNRVVKDEGDVYGNTQIPEIEMVRKADLNAIE